ncbi:MAG TPA: hypothetical protein VMW09_08350, partial [Desulfatiglandales bacterium]|nr:hypothetical protein [Desulfatiglandales bacterium]
MFSYEGIITGFQGLYQFRINSRYQTFRADYENHKILILVSRETTLTFFEQFNRFLTGFPPGEIYNR